MLMFGIYANELAKMLLLLVKFLFVRIFFFLYADSRALESTVGSLFS